MKVAGEFFGGCKRGLFEVVAELHQRSLGSLLEVAEELFKGLGGQRSPAESHSKAESIEAWLSGALCLWGRRRGIRLGIVGGGGWGR